MNFCVEFIYTLYFEYYFLLHITILNIIMFKLEKLYFFIKKYSFNY